MGDYFHFCCCQLPLGFQRMPTIWIGVQKIAMRHAAMPSLTADAPNHESRPCRDASG